MKFIIQIKYNYRHLTLKYVVSFFSKLSLTLKNEINYSNKRSSRTVDL